MSHTAFFIILLGVGYVWGGLSFTLLGVYKGYFYFHGNNFVSCKIFEAEDSIYSAVPARPLNYECNGPNERVKSCTGQEWDQTYTLYRHCYDIDPQKRLDCGYYGIRKKECEIDRGCCYDDTVQGVPWCFRSKTDLADKCRSIDVKKRADCGWIGITKEVCKERGCCYDDSGYNMGSKYCFYPKSSKCHDIAPENRKDCGYFGIGRDECEKDRNCCFDHTVQGVPWCFFGHKRQPPVAPQTKVPTKKPTEEGATEGSTEEPSEPSVGAKIIPGG